MYIYFHSRDFFPFVCTCLHREVFGPENRPDLHMSSIVHSTLCKKSTACCFGKESCCCMNFTCVALDLEMRLSLCPPKKNSAAAIDLLKPLQPSTHRDTREKKGPTCFAAPTTRQASSSRAPPRQPARAAPQTKGEQPTRRHRPSAATSSSSTTPRRSRP